MSRFYPVGGGAPGVNPKVLTALPGDVIKDKLAGVKDNYEPVMGTLALSGSATDYNVLAGQTYYNTDPKVKRTGAIPIQGADAGNGWAHATAMQIDPDGQFFLGVRNGYYLNGVNWIRGYNPNLIPSNVRKGIRIGNLLGTMIDYSYLMTGQTSF